MCQYPSVLNTHMIATFQWELALARRTKLITAKFAKTNGVTKVNTIVAVLTEQFLPFIDHNKNFFPLLWHILFISAATTLRNPMANESNYKSQRAPSEIYGWPCGGMKSSIFLSISRPEFQTRSWLKKYRATRGSYDASGSGSDDRRLLRNFNLSHIHGISAAACFISRSFIFDLFTFRNYKFSEPRAPYNLF